MLAKEIIKQTGITKDTLRYYNEVGLLSPTINPDNNYRIYSEDDISTVQLTKGLQDIGFTIKEIIEINQKLQDTGCKHKKTLPFLKEQRVKIIKKIKELKQLDKKITSIISNFETKNCDLFESDFSI